MRFRHAMTVVLFVCVPAMASSSLADTIVLKSGRRIVVDQATESKDRVIGETPSGQISFPRSAVARVEHNALSLHPSAAGNPAAGSIAIAPPVASADDFVDPEVLKGVIRDGAIDSVYLAQLDQSALTSAPGSAARAAVAHHAAAQFEMARGNADGAMDQERQALRYLPNSVPLLLNIAYGHLRRSEFTAALELLNRAKKIAPDSPDVAKLMGWSLYGLNRLPQAVEEWKRSQKLQPDEEVAKALERAERDARTESEFREGQTSHFVLKYSGAAAPTLAGEILHILELHFSQVSSLLDFSPPEPIGVILYTGQDFQDITRAPSWVGAINDGRIRIPVQGLTSVTDQLSMMLRHELTHSFLQQKTRGRCPVWLQEGIAQWMEGRRTGSSASALLNAYDRRAAIPLTDLEISWMNLSETGESFAYAWSLAVIETILANNSMSNLMRILDSLATSSSPEAAVRSVLHESYSELEQQTAVFLRARYGH